MGWAAIKFNDTIVSIDEGEDCHYDILARVMREQSLSEEDVDLMIAQGQIEFGHCSGDGSNFTESPMRRRDYHSVEAMRDYI